eukprot:4717726-Amphidinium_carterae.1
MTADTLTAKLCNPESTVERVELELSHFNTSLLGVGEGSLNKPKRRHQAPFGKPPFEDSFVHRAAS